MALNYKKLGELISEVDERNSNSSVNNLIGVTLDKVFIPSVANTNGTDLSKYKIIKENQFACSLMQVSRDNGVAISLYKNKVPSIMSPAYYIFEVVSDCILPEYLELVVCSPEFDREATFNAVGGVRGTLTWEDFCALKINIPSIEEQQKIVNQYNIITNRINVLNKLKNKQLELSQILYNYFVNTEDCYDSSLLDNQICKLVKSGIDKFNDTKIYLTTSDVFKDVINQNAEMIKYNIKPSRANMQPKYWSLWFAKMKNTSKYIFIDDSFDIDRYIFSTGFAGLEVEETYFYYFWCFLMNVNFEIFKDAFCNGTTQEAINEEGISKIPISVPKNKESLKKFNKNMRCIFKSIQNITDEIYLLEKVKYLIIEKV